MNPLSGFAVIDSAKPSGDQIPWSLPPNLSGSGGFYCTLFSNRLIATTR